MKSGKTETFISLRRADAGATMIEFALIAVVFFGLIGAIFDLGLGWYRYSNLTNTVALAARSTSQGLFRSRGQACAAVGGQAAATATTIYRQRYGIGNPTFNGEVLLPVGSPAAIRVSGTIPLECIFCNMFPANIILRAQADAMIEHGGFTCSK